VTKVLYIENNDDNDNVYLPKMRLELLDIILLEIARHRWLGSHAATEGQSANSRPGMAFQSLQCW
jgi:hypothetical protein